MVIKKIAYMFLPAWVLIISISALFSWNTGEIIEYRNEKTTGTLVGFTAEQIKHSKSSVTHNLYVQYKVDGFIVAFPASTSIPYVQNAVIYKNLK